MNNALGIAVVFDFITLIAVVTGLEVFVDVVGIVDFVDVFVVIGYWLFDVGIGLDIKISLVAQKHIISMALLTHTVNT